jgi:pheromone a factor receptor
VIVDLCIGLGVPLLSAALYIIPQGHRFNIFQELGCEMAAYSTIAAVLLINLWPLLIAIISGAYTCLIFYTLVRRNSKLKELVGSDPNLTFSRYWRLIILSSMDIIFTIPLYSFSLYLTVLNLQPWISWDNVHADFGRIDQFTSLTWRGNAVVVITMEFNRWSYVLCAFVVFALFGFGADAMRDYRSTWTSVSSCIALFATSARKTLSLSSSTSIHSWGHAPVQRSDLPIFIQLDHTQDLQSSNFTSSSSSTSSQGLDSYLKTLTDRSGAQVDSFKVVSVDHI